MQIYGMHKITNVYRRKHNEWWSTISLLSDVNFRSRIETELTLSYRNKDNKKQEYLCFVSLACDLDVRQSTWHCWNLLIFSPVSVCVRADSQLCSEISAVDGCSILPPHQATSFLPTSCIYTSRRDYFLTSAWGQSPELPILFQRMPLPTPHLW
jgi:hypothetical protein